MKKVKITLVSHYFGRKMCLMLNAVDAEELKMYGNDAVNVLYDDYNRIVGGWSPLFLSRAQAQKLHGWFAHDNSEYFDRIEY